MSDDTSPIDATPQPDTGPAPIPESVPSPPGAADQVSRILAAVEQQLDQLRDIQREHDAQLADLALREHRLEETRRDIEQQRQQIDRQQEHLDTQRARWEQERQQVQDRHEAQSAELSRRSLASDEQQHRLDERQDDLVARCAALDEQQQAFDAEKDDWIRRQRAVEEQHARQHALLDERQAQLDHQRHAVEAEWRRQADAASQAGDDRRKLEELARQLDDDRAAFHEQVAAAETRAEAAAREVAELTRLVDTARSAFHEKTAELDHANARAAELEADLASADERVAQATADVSDHARQLERELADLREQLASADQRVAQATADASDHARQLERELADLREQLASAQRDREEAAAWAEAAQQQFEQARQHARDADQRAARSDAALEHARADLRAAEQQLAELNARLQEQARRLDEITDVSVYEQRIASLENEVDGLRRAAGETARTLDAERAAAETANNRAAELQQQADELHAEIERLNSRPQTHAATDRQLTAAAEEATSLRRRIAELEAQLHDATSRSAPDKTGTESAMLDDLRAKARRLAAVSEHLKRRRDRLTTLRRLMRRRRPDAPPSRAEAKSHAVQARYLQEKHQELTDLKHMLAAAERKMIRRWARPRAVVTVGWLLVLAAVAAGAGWLAADRYFPATVSASVTLQAKSRDHASLSHDQAQRWRDWHTQLLGDQSFRHTLAKRMKERRLDRFADLAALNRSLDDELTLDTAGQESIVLTLAGTDRRELTAFLDILASTVSTESNRQLRRRSDAAWAVPADERREHGRLCYSSLNPCAIKDDRLMYAASIFGAAYAAALALVGLVYARLVKARREFDEDGELFADPSLASSHDPSAP